MQIFETISNIMIIVRREHSKLELVFHIGIL